MHIHLNRSLLARIYAHLESTYPNEGGGFLLGNVTPDSVRIAESIPVENVFEEAEQYHRYAMTPQDWMKLEDTADARGLTLIGYYHSHPDSPAIPSEYDRDHALPNFVYLITSVREAKAQYASAWRLNEDRQAFTEHLLVVQDDLSAEHESVE